MIKPVFILAVLGSSIALSGCEEMIPKPPQSGQVKILSRMECPEALGSLTRKSASADGLNCVYLGSGESAGSEIELRLVSLEGSTLSKAIGPIDAELKALMKSTAANAPVPPKPPEVPGKDSDNSGEPDEVHISLPGLKVDVDEKTETARIKLPGVRVNASDDKVEVEIGTSLDAAENSDAPKSPVPRRISRKVILASDKAGNAFGHAGYVLRGPDVGPVVVGLFKVPARAESETEERDGDKTIEDADALVRHILGEKGSSGAFE